MPRLPIVVALAVASVVELRAGSAVALSPDQVGAGFQEAVVNYCLEAALRGVDLSNLPASDRTGITPANESMRDMVGKTNPSGPIWDVRRAQGIVLISEPRKGVCEVLAYGAPVERTFKRTLDSARKRAPGLVEKAADAAYNPIAYRLEKVSDGTRVSVRLSGAEPGTPGHMMRFSLLMATVARDAPE